MPVGEDDFLSYFVCEVDTDLSAPVDYSQFERPSYVLNDYKWAGGARGTAGGTITWAVVTAGQSYPSQADYSSQATGITSAFMSTIRAAFARWDEVGNFSLVETTSPLTADITLIFDELQNQSPNTIGLAYTWSNSLNAITNSYISFDIGRRYRLIDGSVVTVGTSTSSSSLDFYTLALHEIGHALGLDHEDDFDTVMSSIQSDLTDLTSDDIAGIHAIYGSTNTTPTTDDYPASSATTASVTVGGTATGRIDNSSDEDWFRISLTAGTSYRIDLRGYDSSGGTLLDPYLRLLNSSGAAVAVDDDSGVGTDSQILFTVSSSGTYYVAASGYDGEQGTYTISVATSATGDDYAANTNTTGAVAVGGSTTGRLETSTDTDWFAVTLTGGQSYSIEVRGSATNGGTLLDPYVRVRSSSGVIYASDDDSGTGLDARVTYIAAFTGVHYIEAASANSQSGTYTVSVANVTPVDDYAATTSTTGAVTVGGTVTGSVETAGDRDWFRVSLAAGTAYRFDLRGSATSGGTLSDPYVVLRNSSGTQLAIDNDSGQGLDARLSYTPTTSGTYFIEARSSSSSATGTYTLGVTATSTTDDYAGSTSTTGTVAPGTSVNGTIGAAADSDWFRVTLTAGVLYRFDARGAASSSGTLADPLLSLLSSSGAAIVTDNNSGSGADARILFKASTSGTYYLAMSSASSSATGTYSITATANPDDYTATTATAGSVSSGGTASGVVETAGDRDWFRTTLTAGTAYNIEVRGTAPGSGVRWTESSLVLRDSTGAMVTSATQSGLGAAARLFYTPTASGTFYIDALAYSTGVGSYDVSLTAATGLQAPAIVEEIEQPTGLADSHIAALTAPPEFDLADYAPYSTATTVNLIGSPFADLLAAPGLPEDGRPRLEVADLARGFDVQRWNNPFLLPLH